MGAIFKRELGAYVTSPVGYVYLAVFWFFAGYFLFTGSLVNNSASLSPVFQAMINVIMVLSPLLTMRLLSEERRNKTDQALLTAPVTRAAIVAGKFFAAAAVYLAAISIILIQAAALSFFTTVNWALVSGSFIATALLGFSFIAIGEFISGLTENMAVAAVGTFAAMLILFLLDGLSALLPLPALQSVAGSISFIKRYTPITRGLLGIGDLLFFASVCTAFLFFTAKTLEKRRSAFSLLTTLLVVGVIIAFNLVIAALSAKKPLSIDLTANKAFALSDETKNILANIDEDITVYVMNGERAFSETSPPDYFSQAGEVLRRYTEASPRIRLLYIDLLRNPDFAARYPEFSLKLNDIVITAGNERRRLIEPPDLFNIGVTYNRSEVVSSRAEQTLTRAIFVVSSTYAPRASVISPPTEDISAFIETLEMNNYEVIRQNLLTGAVAENVSLLILAAPARDLSEAELRSVDDFLSREGDQAATFFYLASAAQGPLPNIDAFLAEWGIACDRGVLFETDNERILGGSPYIGFLDYAEEEMRGFDFSRGSRARSLRAVMPQSRPLRMVFEDGGYRKVTPLLRTSESSGLRPPDAAPDWRPALENRAGKTPVLLLSRSLRNTQAGKLQQSNVLAAGSSLALNRNILSSASVANALYFLDIFSELQGQENRIHIVEKSLGSPELGATLDQVMVITIVFTAILPLALLLSGLIVWLRRRHR